ncbi:MAG: hypothetical protein LBL87_08105 [Ruminococcus sp.]|nr:hypothetical protein [Ruminococcus sp.]
MFENENSEEARYGRNKSLAVDHNYINGGEYRRKFDNISENNELNKNLYQCAKAMLAHRSGTDFEDMYWLDGDSGKIIASVTDMTVANRVDYTDGFLKKIRLIKKIYTIHNHPNSMPPSISDFIAAYRNKYKTGIVACNNGTLYLYRNLIEPDKSLYDALTLQFSEMGYTDFTSERMALEEMASMGVLEFKEVN